jgi:hypothetical protein
MPSTSTGTLRERPKPGIVSLHAHSGMGTLLHTVQFANRTGGSHNNTTSTGLYIRSLITMKAELLCKCCTAARQSQNHRRSSTVTGLMAARPGPRLTPTAARGDLFRACEVSYCARGSVNVAIRHSMHSSSLEVHAMMPATSAAHVNSRNARGSSTWSER